MPGWGKFYLNSRARPPRVQDLQFGFYRRGPASDPQTRARLFSIIPGLDERWDRRFYGRVPPPEERLAKQEANYRFGDPARDERRACANCANYRAPFKCTAVRGFIQLRAVCDRWHARPSPPPDERLKRAISDRR